MLIGIKASERATFDDFIRFRPEKKEAGIKDYHRKNKSRLDLIYLRNLPFYHCKLIIMAST